MSKNIRSGLDSFPFLISSEEDAPADVPIKITESELSKLTLLILTISSAFTTFAQNKMPDNMKINNFLIILIIIVTKLLLSIA
jgi:hypothetical protein